MVALAGVQLSVVACYLAATVAPYLVYFVVPGRPLFSAQRPNVAPAEVLGASGSLLDPRGWLVILGFLVTAFGAVLAGGLSLTGVAVLARFRRRIAPASRAWLVTGTVLCAALLAFQLTPLGADLANWVSD